MTKQTGDAASPASATAPLETLVRKLARSAESDPEFQSRATALHMTIGFRDLSSRESAWIRISERELTSGGGDADTRFVLQGNTSAWQELVGGMPINRLVRQGKIEIAGDARACMQNWLVVFALTQASSRAQA